MYVSEEKCVKQIEQENIGLEVLSLLQIIEDVISEPVS